MRSAEIFNKKTARLIDEINRDIADGKNLSPAYNDVKTFISSLRVLTARKKKRR